MRHKRKLTTLRISERKPYAEHCTHSEQTTPPGQPGTIPDKARAETHHAPRLFRNKPINHTYFQSILPWLICMSWSELQ